MGFCRNLCILVLKICLGCVVAKSVLPQFTGFCVEKNWAKKFVCGEKMTNIRSAEEHQQRLGSVDAFIGSAQCLKWTLYNKDDFFSLGRQVRQPYTHTVRDAFRNKNGIKWEKFPSRQTGRVKKARKSTGLLQKWWRTLLPWSSISVSLETFPLCERFPAWLLKK